MHLMFLVRLKYRTETRSHDRVSACQIESNVGILVLRKAALLILFNPPFSNARGDECGF